MLVHEADPAKGGAPLPQLQAECPLSKVDQVFGGRAVIQWHRLSAYRLVALKTIASACLHASPEYCRLSHLPELYVPGELSMSRLVFHGQVHLYVSKSNPGAIHVAEEVCEAHGGGQITIHESPLGQQQHLRRFSSLGSLMGQRASTSVGGFLSHGPTHSKHRQLCGHYVVRVCQQRLVAFAVLTSASLAVLLYLNARTWVYGDGAKLAEEVVLARARGLPIVMVHENDPDRGGCEFGRSLVGRWEACDS